MVYIVIFIGLFVLFLVYLGFSIKDYQDAQNSPGTSFSFLPNTELPFPVIIMCPFIPIVESDITAMSATYYSLQRKNPNATNSAFVVQTENLHISTFDVVA